MSAPTLVLLILALLVVLVPGYLLDVLFTFNIMLGLLMVMITLNTKPLEFSSFPSVLLIATLLVIGTQRSVYESVLVEGHSGTDAAGRSLSPLANSGFIIFLILMIINFTLSRRAPTCFRGDRRFTSDAMPGKQMAIDADLNARIIDQDAKQRRNEFT